MTGQIENIYYNLSRDKLIPMLDRADYENRLNKYEADKDFNSIIDLLKSIKLKHKSDWVEDTLRYFLIRTSKQLSKKKTIESPYMPRDLEALINLFEDDDYDKKVIKLEEEIPYDLVKGLACQVVEGVLHRQHRVVFPFIVSENAKLEGKVIYQQTGLSPYSLVTNNSKGSRVKFLGDPKINSNSETFIDYLYTYIFISDDLGSHQSMEYTVLSKEPLPLEEVKLKGMIIPIMDNLKVGSSGSLCKGAEVIFVTEFKPLVRTVTTEQFTDLIVPFKGAYNKLYSSFYGDFRHPPIFEKFLLSWLFSTKLNYRQIGGYPAHFGWIGPGGSGKTVILECLEHVFNESGVSENSTFKSLVPNFGGSSRPDPGLFCKANRVLLVEEFFRLIMKTKGDDTDVGLLNTLLEHKIKKASSGKFDGATLLATPKASFFFVTNYLPYKLTDFAKLTKSIAPEFLSRFILYNQTKYHTDFVDAQKGKHLENLDREEVEGDPNDCYPVYNPGLLEIIDYMKTTKARIGPFSPQSIFDEVAKYVPDESGLKRVYHARGLKHILSIMDGVCKLNYILDGKTGPFEVTKQDYEETLEMWRYIIYSWTDNLLDLPITERESYLTRAQSQVYSYICANPNATLYILEKELKRAVRLDVQELLTYQLIKENEFGSKKGYISHWFDINSAKMDVEVIEDAFQ